MKPVLTYSEKINNQLQSLGHLPAPSPEAVDHSEQLDLYLRQQAMQQGGALAFDQFMELALYAPGLGYYAAGAEKLGASGDFVTAPEISPLFSEALAEQIAQVILQLKESQLKKNQLIQPNVLEFGAGRGIMAADILRRLEQLECLPKIYFILERSAELKQRQQETLKTEVPHLFHLIQWLDTLPEQGFRGVMIANEVVDAMAVKLFEKQQGQLFERFVVAEESGWKFENRPAEKNLTQSAYNIEQQLGQPFDDGYQSEVNLIQRPWLESLADCLEQGMILLIDYGFPTKEYYHPQRMGTLMCHYRHRAHSDPLLLLGLQDITAHVDFTDLAETAFNKGLTVAGYIDQGSFLTNCGLLQRMEQLSAGDADKMLRYSQQAKFLMLPTEMGELFKVIAFTQDLNDTSLLGFTYGDRRAKL